MVIWYSLLSLFSLVQCTISGSNIQDSQFYKISPDIAAYPTFSENPKIGNILYIRHGLFIGDRYGIHNGTDLVKSNIEKLSQLSELDKRLTVGNFNVNEFYLATGVAIVATIACVFVPGCPAFVGTQLGSAVASFSTAAGVSAEAAISVAATVGTAATKRQSADSEVWGCGEAAGGTNDMCTICETTDFVTPISMDDGTSAGSFAGSIYLVSEGDSISGIIGYMYHCISDTGSCSLPESGDVQDIAPVQDDSQDTA